MKCDSVRSIEAENKTGQRPKMRNRLDCVKICFNGDERCFVKVLSCLNCITQRSYTEYHPEWQYCHRYTYLMFLSYSQADKFTYKTYTLAYSAKERCNKA